jgi:hypothetical protein
MELTAKCTARGSVQLLLHFCPAVFLDCGAQIWSSYLTRPPRGLEQVFVY